MKKGQSLGEYLTILGVVILIALVILGVMYSQSNDAEVKPSDKVDIGNGQITKVITPDGVTCYVFYGYQKGGLDCDFEGSR